MRMGIYVNSAGPRADLSEYLAVVFRGTPSGLYADGPSSGLGYSWAGWSDYAARNGIVFTPGTVIKGGGHSVPLPVELFQSAQVGQSATCAERVCSAERKALVSPAVVARKQRWPSGDVAGLA